MSKHHGPSLLLIILAVPCVGGAHASTIQEPAKQHASTFYGAPALRMPSKTDSWRGDSSRRVLCLVMSATSFTQIGSAFGKKT